MARSSALHVECFALSSGKSRRSLMILLMDFGSPNREIGEPVEPSSAVEAGRLPLGERACFLFLPLPKGSITGGGGATEMGSTSTGISVTESPVMSWKSSISNTSSILNWLSANRKKKANDELA